jgi:hypothetical protein
MNNTFKCTCNNVEVGSYANQIWVHSPSHMYKVNGYCLDRCVAEEVMGLWMLGITTTGCCCGHGKVTPYIGVINKDIARMKEFGYSPTRSSDEDSFSPIGKEKLLSIVKKQD